MLQKLIELLRPDVSTDAKLSGVSLFIGKTLDKYDQRLEKLESRQLIRGEDGDKGDSGKDGKSGKDGSNGKAGLDGSDGKDGKPGIKGIQGVSVVDADIAADGNLVLKLSNGKEIDAGRIEGGKSSAIYSQKSNAATPSESVELDFGAGLGVTAKSFTVTNSTITAVNKMFVLQSLAAPTGKSQDENEMDAFNIRAVAGEGNFTMYAESLFGSVVGKFKFNYTYL